MSTDSKELINKLCITIPSQELIAGVRGMSAACDDRKGQAARFNWAIAKLEQLQPLIADLRSDFEIKPTGSFPENPKYLTLKDLTLWQELFDLIQSKDELSIKEIRAQSVISGLIDNNDLLIKAILSAHDSDYLFDIINSCCIARRSQLHKKACTYKKDDDVIFTPKTFEFIIRDLIATIEYRQKVNFSITLPCHHAHYDHAEGFCILNTVKILSAFDQYLAESADDSGQGITKIIIGIDVNRDDGLSDSWWHNDSCKLYRHIDIFDSRVYPVWLGPQDLKGYLDKLILEPTDAKRRDKVSVSQEQNGLWYKYSLDTNEYMAIDLAKMQRGFGPTRDNPDNIHKAIITAIEKIKDEIQNSIDKKRKAAIYIPMGWDSHVDEIAPCSGFKEPREKDMQYQQRRVSSRFNNKDFKYFYKEIWQLLNNPIYNSAVQSVYFSLEGGYTQKVNDQQLEMFMRQFASSTIDREPELTLQAEERKVHEIPIASGRSVRRAVRFSTGSASASAAAAAAKSSDVSFASKVYSRASLKRPRDKIFNPELLQDALLLVDIATNPPISDHKHASLMRF